VIRLEAAGAVILGKTNCGRIRDGSYNREFGVWPVKNPVALDCVPGGSSGGRRRRWRRDLAVAALGTDTGRVHPATGGNVRDSRR